LELQAAIDGPSSGPAPFAPEFTVQPSPGAVIETVLNFLKNGAALPAPVTDDLLNGINIGSGRHVAPETFDEPAQYQAVITRTGITSDGIQKIMRHIPFTVSDPPPAHPPITPPPSSQPTCAAELSPDGVISSDFTTMRISGNGFLPGEEVEIIESGTVLVTVTATQPFGSYTVDHDFLHGIEPTEHSVMAHGARSGRDSNTAGFSV
jgi:hypothetical protein